MNVILRHCKLVKDLQCHDINILNRNYLIIGDHDIDDNKYKDNFMNAHIDILHDLYYEDIDYDYYHKLNADISFVSRGTKSELSHYFDDDSFNVYKELPENHKIALFYDSLGETCLHHTDSTVVCKKYVKAFVFETKMTCRSQIVENEYKQRDIIYSHEYNEFKTALSNMCIDTWCIDTDEFIMIERNSYE